MLDEHPLDREAARIAELHRLSETDAAADAKFHVIVRAAASLFDVPIALLTLVDAKRQWFKAAIGVPFGETAREHSFCSYTVAVPERVMIVPNASLDVRFMSNPHVTGEPNVRFYAGAPLVSSRGFAIGSLCVIDRQPRIFTEDETGALRALAVLVMQIMEGANAISTRGGNLATSESPQAGVAAFSWNRELRISSWSEPAAALLGWTAAEVIGEFPPFVLDADRTRFTDDCRDVLRGSLDTVRLCTVATKSGQRFDVALAAKRTVDAGGLIRGYTTIATLAARSEPVAAATPLVPLMVNANDAVTVVAAPAAGVDSGSILFVNEAFTQVMGFGWDEAVGNTPAMLAGPATDPDMAARVAAMLEHGDTASGEVVRYRRDGTPIYVEFCVVPVMDADGACRYALSIERETTSRRAMETYEFNRSLVLEMAVRNEPLATQLAHVVMLLKSVIPGTLGTVVLLDGDRITAGAADPDLSAEYIRAIEGTRIGPDVGSCGTAMYRREAVICGDIETDGRWRHYRAPANAAGLRSCWSMPFFSTGGDVVGAFALYADRPAWPSIHELQMFEETARFASLVIERNRDRQRLERMAHYDALTNLPNRGVVEDALGRALARAGSTGKVVALGVLDIDRFKAINEAFGHRIGDQLLRKIADRLAASLRPGDSIGRMAGDVFIAVFTDLDHTVDGVNAATRLMEEFDSPFRIEGHEIVVRPSLGLAFFPAASTETLGLFQAADKAMYAAKLRGGGLEVALRPITGSALALLDLEKDLRYALDRFEFELHFQLMYDLADGRPVGAEALLRWRHPQLGMIGPTEFVPLAEANGTIVPIGSWVIREAARVARGWQDAGRNAFVSVNVSALQFDAPGLVATVMETLAASALEPWRLHLELTESLVMRNPTASAAMLLQLKALGVRIVIDDFGTGYSSLAYLQCFTFDALKIDRSFLRGFGDIELNQRSEQIVAAVAQFGAALGVTTIAEGVETAAQYAFVQSCGCHVVQGFLCARPVPPDQLDWSVTGGAFGSEGRG